MALGREIVNLVGLVLLDQADHVGGICQVAIVHEKSRLVLMRINVEIIYAPGIERGRSTFDAMHYVPFSQQEAGQMGAVLSRNARDQCDRSCQELIPFDTYPSSSEYIQHTTPTQ